jgi:hypothetical protein
MSDELSGDGMIILDGESIATVYYWLTVVPEPGAVIAEGSISGWPAMGEGVAPATRAEYTTTEAIPLRLRAKSAIVSISHCVPTHPNRVPESTLRTWNFNFLLWFEDLVPPS